MVIKQMSKCGRCYSPLKRVPSDDDDNHDNEEKEELWASVSVGLGYFKTCLVSGLTTF